VLETEYGYRLPRRMQIEFSQVVQDKADTTGEEIVSEQVKALFEQTYLARSSWPRLVGDRRIETREEGSRDAVEATLAWGEVEYSLGGEGAGPVDAFVAAVCEALGIEMRVGDYHEHALGAGAAASAAAYVEIVFGPDRRLFGAGVAQSIVEASFAAVLSAVARAADHGWIARPEAGQRQAMAAGSV
jgi:2-isopropylmalate synthase